MTRIVALIAAAAALCLALAPDAPARRVVLGMGEQQTGMFTEPRYERPSRNAFSLRLRDG